MKKAGKKFKMVYRRITSGDEEPPSPEELSRPPPPDGDAGGTASAEASTPPRLSRHSTLKRQSASRPLDLEGGGPDGDAEGPALPLSSSNGDAGEASSPPLREVFSASRARTVKRVSYHEDTKKPAPRHPARHSAPGGERDSLSKAAEETRKCALEGTFSIGSLASVSETRMDSMESNFSTSESSLKVEHLFEDELVRRNSRMVRGSDPGGAPTHASGPVAVENLFEVESFRRNSRRNSLAKESSRVTVHVENPSEFAEQVGAVEHRGSITDYPEVDMIIRELNKRVATLESMVESMSSQGGATSETAETDDDEGDALPGSDALPDGAAATTVTIAPDQMLALKGLASNVRGLIRCVNHRHSEQRNRILLALDSDDEIDEDSRALLAFRGDDSFDNSEARLLRTATTASKKKILGDILNPERLEPTRGQRRRRQTVAVADLDERSSVVPDELILGMMETSNSSLSNSRKTSSRSAASTAAHIAHEYGGVELPRRFTMGNKRVQRRSLKSFAKSVSAANVFVSQARLQANFGTNELEYLPREFTRLGLAERKRLAEMLSWKGLKRWGFDMFEVERRSAVTLFQRGAPSTRHAVPKSDSLTESENSLLDDVLESSRHGCPVVLVGWALFSSPYSQLAMARNVNDEGLIESALGAIRQRANTNAGKMAQRMMKSDSGDWSWSCGESPKDGGGSRGGNGKGTEQSNAPDVADKDGSANLDPSNGESKEKENGKDDSDGAGSDLSAESCPPNGGETAGKPREMKDGYDWNGGYFLPDEFEIAPRAVCHFLRKVEKDYASRKVNPYHNNIHAADVMQSTHALIQMGGEDMALAYPPLEIYSILLSAAMHDVKHPGNNNNYEINKMTELSLTYNDNSVLENMHACRASHLLKDEDDRGGGWDGRGGKNGGNSCSGSVLGSMTKDQRRMLRTSMIRSILYTDMTRHFSEVAKIRRHVDTLEDEVDEGRVDRDGDMDGRGRPPPALLTRIGGERHVKLREKLLPFLLHLADIGGTTKPHDVSSEWARAVYDEFFQQGDKEAAEGLPVSPLCDRATTSIPEAQVGFLNFVVKPAYVLLARCIPDTKEVVISQLEENFVYWVEQKEMQNSTDGLSEN